jgi:hypothetical protein
MGLKSNLKPLAKEVNPAKSLVVKMAEPEKLSNKLDLPIISLFMFQAPAKIATSIFQV